ncbi:Holliday junction branch migration DNA helicase RuvB [candidate division WWE3 bacterium]|uniref:Holliday junction branch migration complex subunit RuvB n=1 Tax=candidate division WWE3 bacterium TaxID=2053526 RepID=A0A955LLM1_UNCKA|nr:Holliday junction branch migration DNA helicase RuvB [candidate division WWE3 bacterium]
MEFNDDITNEKGGTDEVVDSSFRPQRLVHYHGQNDLKKNVNILIKATQKRKEPLDHILFYGPPGLGKTTLARVIANELNVNVRLTSGPAVERAGDLASILTNLEDGDVLFIDEIHRLPKVVEETLYPAMEEFALDIIVGRGPSARTLRLDLPRFTVVGATTRIGLIGAPMRDRFGAIFRLEYYDDDDLRMIINQSARILNVEITSEAMLEIARRSRGTPRVANRLLRRVRDYAQVKDKDTVEVDDVKKTCKLLGVDEIGLSSLDYHYLQTLATRFSGGPVGVETISAAISEDKQSIEDVIEPFLLQKGLIKKTPRGRAITEKGENIVSSQKENRLF